MTTLEAEIYGYLLDWQRGGKSRKQGYENRNANGSVEAPLATDRDAAGAVDGRPYRGNQRRYSLYTGSQHHPKAHIVMDYACYALWGGIAGCFVLFVVWTISKI